ncbi:MAG TPA: 30S ribosomal protein S18 [Candidatus Acidoferrales bacterium]|nr:30S ribosomal protein S18 [Candidatus Acidoferrales bacterium]
MTADAPQHPSHGPHSGGPGGGPRGDRPPRKPRRQYVRKRKVCRFCVEKMDYIDYKNADLLKGFILDRGKVVPRRITGTCARHQRWLKVAIKRARNIALLPFAAGA